MKTAFLLTLFIIMVCGIGYGIHTAPPVDPNTQPEVVEMKTPPKAETKGRFQVERVGTFSDSMAYDGKRGIYVVKDAQTGREYVGVSGVGIAEVGSHTSMCGKMRCTTIDER